jgi:hypothetical protein
MLSERKTVKRLLHMTLEVKASLEADWHVEVIMLTSDASGKLRKGRMDLVKAVPSIVGLDCYSHQVFANYPVWQLYGNYKLSVADQSCCWQLLWVQGSIDPHFAAKATGLITWLHSKTQSIGPDP